jgi:ankyrin repeat protein
MNMFYSKNIFVLSLWLASLLGCSNQENKVKAEFQKATELFKQANLSKNSDKINYYKKQIEALNLIDELPLKYPQSTFVIQLLNGDIKIYGSSINQIRNSLTPKKSIYDAAKNGDIDMVKLHLAMDINVNAQDTINVTPLSYAAHNSNLDIVELLVINGADINGKDREGSFTPLIHAVLFADIRTIDGLILLGANIDEVSDKNIESTPLNYAIHRYNKTKNGESFKIIKTLIENGANINGTYNSAISQGLKNIPLDLKFYGTPLDYVEIGDVETLKLRDYLIEKGAKTSLELNDDRSITAAAESGDLIAVKEHIQNGADINRIDSNSKTPLFLSTEMGHLDIVRYLVSKGAKLNTIDPIGITVLHVAASAGHIDIVKLLCESGINVDIESPHGSPLQQATKAGNFEIVKFLIANGANVNSAVGVFTRGQTPLHYTADKGFIEIAKFLIEKSANLEAKNDSESFLALGTPLCSAAANGKVSMVELLIKSGANVNAFDGNGNTPLHQASHSSKDSDDGSTRILNAFGVELPDQNSEVAKLLVENGANKNKKNLKGHTPLDKALARKDFIVFNYLKSKGAKSSNQLNYAPSQKDITIFLNAINDGNLNLVNKYLEFGMDADVNNSKTGSTGLHIASWVGLSSITHLKITKGLINFGADVNLKDKQGWSALSYSAYQGNIEITKLLINNGANLNIKDNLGSTAFHHAVSNNKVNIVKQLLDSGADLDIKNNIGKNPMELANDDLKEIIKKHKNLKK